MPHRRILVTGGCGFIGSNFINYYFPKQQDSHFFLLNMDAMYYCARESNVEESIRRSDQYKLIEGNTANIGLVRAMLNLYQIDTVVHFAAQSHVDDSFENSLQYTQDNVLGTHHLLEACRQYGNITKFIHVSTDEVYGESFLGDQECKKTEISVLNPTNPYAASKAAAEMYVNSYVHSFGMPVIIIRMNNVYGPRQYEEKLIPRFIKLLKEGKRVTIQGSGEQVRSFIHVDDVSRAFDMILSQGKVGEIYNIGAPEGEEYSVLHVAQILIQIIHGCRNDTESGGGSGCHTPFSPFIEYVEDRPFNDTRYYICSDKLQQLGWQPEVSFETALTQLCLDK